MSTIRIFLLGLFFFTITSMSYAQDNSAGTREIKEKRFEKPVVVKGKKTKGKKNKLSFRRIFQKRLKDARGNFYDRLEANAKADRKIQIELKKPQYSDQSYFGHKRKPKKRKRSKRKFCRECGIMH